MLLETYCAGPNQVSPVVPKRLQGCTWWWSVNYGLSHGSGNVTGAGTFTEPYAVFLLNYLFCSTFFLSEFKTHLLLELYLFLANIRCIHICFPKLQGIESGPSTPHSVMKRPGFQKNSILHRIWRHRIPFHLRKRNNKICNHLHVFFNYRYTYICLSHMLKGWEWRRGILIELIKKKHKAPAAYILKNHAAGWYWLSTRIRFSFRRLSCIFTEVRSNSSSLPWLNHMYLGGSSEFSSHLQSFCLISYTSKRSLHHQSMILSREQSIAEAIPCTRRVDST